MTILDRQDNNFWTSDLLLYADLTVQQQTLRDALEMRDAVEYLVDEHDIEKLREIDDQHTQALNGNIESLFRLSEFYLLDEEQPEDLHLAFRLLCLAAEHGYQPAFPRLGKCYAYGVGTEPNTEAALHWFMQTDYSDDADVLAFLAKCHFKGTGVAKNEHKAFDLWLDAAELGHSDGFWFCKIAADAGYARGQYVLGLFYQNGIGVPSDIQTALQLFHLAAKQGYAPAQCRLGILYSNGEYGIEKDPDIAVQWYKLAAAQNDFAARSRLVDCYKNGEGVEKNIDECARMLRELVQENPEYPKGEPSSQYRLGMLLTNKEYTVYSPQEGVEWLRKSAGQNFVHAQTELGTMYYNGLDDIIKPNTEEAQQWFHKAAEQGSSIAQYCLGEIFYDGNGVPENRDEAFKWYKLAADNGLVRSQ